MRKSNQPTVIAFLDSGIAASSLARLQETIEAMPEVVSVDYESPAEAYEHLKEIFKDQPELVEGVNPDSLPASLRVQVADGAQIAAVRARLSGEAAVESVADQGHPATGFRQLSEPTLSLARSLVARASCRFPGSR